MLNQPTSKLIIICRGKSCQKDGANEVIKAFEKSDTKNIEIRIQYCFGKCGNGPMILILPEEIWYSHVKSQQVNLILNKHFQT